MEAGCRTVDQRFCPSIDEGEAHFVMIGKKLFQVKHYVYRCVGGVAKTIKQLPILVEKQRDLAMMVSLRRRLRTP